MERNKGITLIALVITIIVLLILAGVAIAMLSGENGILKKAAEAKTNTDKSTAKEEKILSSTELQIHFSTENKKRNTAYGYISNIKKDEKVSSLSDDLPDGYTIYKKDGTTLADKGEKLATGMIVKDRSGNTIAKTILFGDINGDGDTDYQDANLISGVIMGGKTDVGSGEDCFKIAGDVNGDGIVNDDDAKYILGSKVEGGQPIDQSQKLRDPDTIRFYTYREVLDEKIEGFPDSYEKVYDENNRYYVVKISENELTVETLKGYFTEKNVKVYKFGDNEDELVETGYVGNNYYVQVGATTCILFNLK